MATDAKPYLTPEEYLRIERAAETKSEYYDGQMYAMSGGTGQHARIAMRIGTELDTRTKGRCQVFSGDLKVYIPSTASYTYPDISVVCGPPRYLDEKNDVLLNPILLVEVLSPSTRNYDRGDKFRNYRLIPSLREYLTIEQDKIAIEQWILIDNHWTLTEHDNPDGILRTLDIEIPIAEIYRGTDLA